MQIVPGNNWLEMSNKLSRKKEKRIVSLSSAEFTQRVVRLNLIKSSILF